MRNPEEAVDALLAEYPEAGEKEDILFTVMDAHETTYYVDGSAGLGWPPQSIFDESYTLMTQHMNLPEDEPVSFYIASDVLPGRAGDTAGRILKAS